MEREHKAPAPYLPYQWGDDVSFVYAIKAMKEGKASPEQQQLVLTRLVEMSGYYDLSYRPDSERDTCFAEGKRFFGAQIVKLMNLPAKVIQEAINRRKASNDPSNSKRVHNNRDQ